MFDKAATADFKMWLGVNASLIILTLYCGVTHSISFIQCLGDRGCCNDCDGCDDCDRCHDCCQTFDCYDTCSGVCQDLSGFTTSILYQ